MREGRVGIIGGGVVGGALKFFFDQAKVYDKYKNLDSIEEVGKCQFIFICVPTPYRNGFDLEALDDAVSNAVRHLQEPANQLVVIKSTAWPGTTQKYQNRYPAVNFCFSPEFLRDRFAKEDFIKNDRQILGYTTKTKGHLLLAKLLKLMPKAPYQKIVRSEAAEMTKYATNTFLALQVIFANQIYDLCEALMLDYELVKEAILSDKRVGQSHWEIWHTERSLQQNATQTYRGYGGKCFPKDINILIAEAGKLGVEVSLFEAGREVNLKLNAGKYDK